MVSCHGARCIWCLAMVHAANGALPWCTLQMVPCYDVRCKWCLAMVHAANGALLWCTLQMVPCYDARCKCCLAYGARCKWCLAMVHAANGALLWCTLQMVFCLWCTLQMVPCYCARCKVHTLVRTSTWLLHITQIGVACLAIVSWQVLRPNGPVSDHNRQQEIWPEGRAHSHHHFSNKTRLNHVQDTTVLGHSHGNQPHLNIIVMNGQPTYVHKLLRGEQVMQKN